MKKCSHCHNPVKENSKFCSSCGQAIENKQTKSRSFSKVKLLIASLVVLTAGGAGTFAYMNREKIASIIDTEYEDETVLEVQAEDPEEKAIIDEDESEGKFYGFWENEHTIFELTETTFTHANKADVTPISTLISEVSMDEDILQIHLAEPDVSLNDSVESLTFEFLEDGSLYSDTIIGSESSDEFTKAVEDETNQFLMTQLSYISEREKEATPIADLSIEDFEGYWFPFDRYGNNIDYPIGSFGVYIDKEYIVTAYMESEIVTSLVHEYHIQGNTLTVKEEFTSWLDFIEFEEDQTRDIERTIIESQMTLFKEENDRDRLIYNNSGFVLQRITLDELEKTPAILEHDYYYSGFSDDLFSDYYLEKLSGLSEERFVFTEEKAPYQPGVNIQNYPYSVGSLSESHLFAEKQIIDGKIPHPEKKVDKESAINQLLDGAFESTPSYEFISHLDRGYYFDSFTDEENIGGVTLGVGGRTEWGSTPGYGHIASVDFEDHIYTVHYTDVNFQAENEQSRFFRINEDVIYAEDTNGQFTQRYEKGTNWDDFQGLPSRDEF